MPYISNVTACHFKTSHFGVILYADVKYVDKNFISN